MPKRLSFLEVGPEAISLSALKKCDERDSIILRLFNPTDDQVEGLVRCYWPVAEAWLTNMNEERREKLKVDGNCVPVPFGKKQIVTLELVVNP